MGGQNFAYGARGDSKHNMDEIGHQISNFRTEEWNVSAGVMLGMIKDDG